MAITAQDVNKLRQMTGAGMMDCKKALTEANGDFDAAIDLLRKKGQKVSASRADRETTEGSVFVKTSDDNSQAILIALTCETDFVAKNDAFLALGNAIVSNAFETKATSVEQLMNNKIGDLTIGDKIIELVGKIGEKLVISEMITMTGETVVPYLHAGNKLGVLVALKGVNGADVSGAGKDVGMQIAAMNPVAVNKDEVAADIVEKELSIGREQAIAEGKPEQIIEKIAQGKLNKYFKDNTLLEQSFVKDNSMTVGKYLDSIESGLTVSSFKRVTIA
jgi:elongation factor Ts